jgi:hypothetical protein
MYFYFSIFADRDREIEREREADRQIDRMWKAPGRLFLFKVSSTDKLPHGVCISLRHQLWVLDISGVCLTRR